MKCHRCNRKLKIREILAESDAENQFIVSYFYCTECGSMYNAYGQDINGETRTESLEDDF